MSKPLHLFGYWRSQATYRIRVAMNFKGIAYYEESISLDDGEQHSEKFLKINPLGSVPALLIDGSPEPLTQSFAILEFLKKQHQSQLFLPKNPIDPARIRSLAARIDAECDKLEAFRKTKPEMQKDFPGGCKGKL